MFAQTDIGWSGAVAVWVFVGLQMVGAGALVIWIAQRTADGRVGPNRWAGTRTHATMSSEEAWAAAHRSGKGPSVVAGWMFVASGVLAPLLAWMIADGSDVAMAWWGGLLTAGTVAGTIILVVGAMRAQRAAKDVRDGFPS